MREKKNHGAGRSRWNEDRSNRRPNNDGGWRFREATTFFICNLPLYFDRKLLHEKLAKIGTMVDLFIVNRKDKHGHQFGFVRYNRVNNSEITATKIRSTIIEGRRLFAKVASFDRKAKDPTPEEHGKTEEPRWIYQPVNKAKETTSYAQVVTAKQQDRATQTSERKRVILNRESIDRKKEIKGRFVAEVINIKAMACIKAVLVGAGFSQNCIDYLGGMWILLTPRTETDTKKLEDKSFTNTWFKCVKPWEEGFRISERLVWLQIEGVPVEYWSHSTFISIASNWGDVIQADLCNFGNNLYDRGVVCIKTEITDIILENITLIVDNEAISIRVKEVEDSSVHMHDIVSKKYVSEESDEEEEQDSNSPESSSDEDLENKLSSEEGPDTEVEETVFFPASVGNDQSPIKATSGNGDTKVAGCTREKSSLNEGNGYNNNGCGYTLTPENSKPGKTGPKENSPIEDGSKSDRKSGGPAQSQKSLEKEIHTTRSGKFPENLTKSQQYQNKPKPKKQVSKFSGEQVNRRTEEESEWFENPSKRLNFSPRVTRSMYRSQKNSRTCSSTMASGTGIGYDQELRSTGEKCGIHPIGTSDSTDNKVTQTGAGHGNL